MGWYYWVSKTNHIHSHTQRCINTVLYFVHFLSITFFFIYVAAAFFFNSLSCLRVLLHADWRSWGSIYWILIRRHPDLDLFFCNISTIHDIHLVSVYKMYEFVLKDATVTTYICSVIIGPPHVAKYLLSFDILNTFSFKLASYSWVANCLILNVHQQL